MYIGRFLTVTECQNTKKPTASAMGNIFKDEQLIRTQDDSDKIRINPNLLTGSDLSNVAPQAVLKATLIDFSSYFNNIDL